MTSDEAVAGELPRVPATRGQRGSGPLIAGSIVFVVAYVPILVVGIAGAPSGLVLAIPVVGPVLDGVGLIGGYFGGAGVILLLDAAIQVLGLGLMVGGVMARNASVPGPSATARHGRRSLQWIVTPRAGSTALGVTFTAVTF